MNGTAARESSSGPETCLPGRKQLMETEQLSQARFTLYKMLSLAYLYPGDIDWQSFCRELPCILADVAEVLPLACSEEIAALADMSLALDFEEICCEHTMLFINNPHTNSISPYESVYLEDTIMGRCTEEVLARYEYYGLEVDARHGYLLPDHIALEFDFMACLIEKSVESGIISLSEQQRFFKDHTAKWVQQFLTDVKGRKPHPYFLVLARVTEQFFLYEKQQFVSLKNQ